MPATQPKHPKASNQPIPLKPFQALSPYASKLLGLNVAPGLSPTSPGASYGDFEGVKTMKSMRNVSYRTDHDDTLHDLLDILFYDEEQEDDNLDKEHNSETLGAIVNWAHKHKLILKR